MTREAFVLKTYGGRHDWHCQIDGARPCDCGFDRAMGVVTFIEPHPASPHYTHVIEDLGEGRWHCITCAGGTFKEIHPDD
jgi:hypothetical protein